MLASLNPKWTQSQWLFAGFATTTIVSILLGIATEFLPLFVLPAIILVIYLAIVDFKKLYFLMLFCIPFGTELELPGGFSTDFPTELFIVGLMFIYLIFSLKNIKRLNSDLIRHPITLLLFFHISWIFITCFPSVGQTVSFKFFLAKIWYVVVFYFLSSKLIQETKDLKTLFWAVFIPLMLTFAYCTIRHANYGFSFKDVNKAMAPFYRNHVSYASILALFAPFCYFATFWYKRWSAKWYLMLVGMACILIGIQLSYTRAAYGAIILAILAYFVIQLRLMKILVFVGLFFISIGLSFLSYKNNYLNFAPNYSKTITHTDFNNLLEATYKLEDISTMERVYRWVAGFQMLKERPLMGFGPGNFYYNYKKYTINAFQTYVSENPEGSGIHSYYLMTSVEQGIIGLFFFLLLSVYVLIKGEQIYHQTQRKERKRIVMTVILSTIIMDTLLTINDMVETDKVGSFFFICMAVLVNIDLENKKQKQKTLSV